MTVEPGLYLCDEGEYPVLFLVVCVLDTTVVGQETSRWVYGMRTMVDPSRSDVVPRKWIFVPEHWKRLDR